MGWGKGVLGSLLDEGGKGEGEGDGERGVRVDEAQNTNMCAFHYWDHFGYKNEQRLVYFLFLKKLLFIIVILS